MYFINVFYIMPIHLHIHLWNVIIESIKNGLCHIVLRASNIKESETVCVQEAHRLGSIFQQRCALKFTFEVKKLPATGINHQHEVPQ